MKILALHGFLGQGADFGPLQRATVRAGWSGEWITPNLFDDLSPRDFESFASAASTVFEKYVEVMRPQVLLGYSMGGRLALQVWRKRPNFLQRLVLFSTHLGLTDPSELLERRRQDADWARRFETENLQLVLKDWNAQKVFLSDDARSISAARPEYIPSYVAALKGLSLADQESLSPGELDSQVLCFVGENDTKFLHLYQGWSTKGLCPEPAIVAGRGHRLLFDPEPEMVGRLVNHLKL